MAKAPAKAPPTPEGILEQEAKDRLAACRAWKTQWEMDFRECYFFSSPHRQRALSSSSSSDTIVRIQDAGDLNTDEAFILCGDFVTEIVNGFMSPDKPWCKRGPGMDLPGGENGPVWKKVKDQIKRDDETIFNAMKASNLYSEVPKAFYPDLSIGTVALWIERPHTSYPILNMAVPLRELEINLGPYGDIDDRFVVRHTRNLNIRELVGEDIWAKITPDVLKKIQESPKQRTVVAWGFWRLWQEKGDETWQHVVMIGEGANHMVHNTTMKGEGCCPLWVGRFNPTPDSPFGLGPLLQGLPSLRQIDEAELMLGENMELSLRPPVTFPSFSFSSVEQGFESGMAYPIEPGHEGAIKNIYTAPPANVGNYAYEDKLKKLRKLFYVDLPEQSGDTPPTRAQWLDEAARAQRRIGTPGMPFWRDLAQIFIRYKYLLEKSQAIEPVQVDGRAVSTQPLNPTQAAAKLQSIAEAANTAATLGGMFPEEFKMNVDGRKSMEAWIDETGTGDLLVLRPLDEVANATQQMAQLAGARHVADPGDQGPQGVA